MSPVNLLPMFPVHTPNSPRKFTTVIICQDLHTDPKFTQIHHAPNSPRYYDSSFTQHGFLLSNGSFTTIDVPGAVATFAFGINRHGDIVGSYYDSSFNLHGFVMRNGRFITIDIPGAIFGTEAMGVDPLSDIVGSFYDGAYLRHGYLLSR